MRLDFGDQGSPQADIRSYLRATRTVLRHPMVRRIIPDLIAERLRSNKLSSMLDGIAVARRQLGMRLLDRAITRNELHPDIDKELAMDLLFSSLYARMIIRRKNFTQADLERFIIALDAGLKAC